MNKQKSLSVDDLISFIHEVWSYHRSLTGDGNRKTLLSIKKLIPDLSIQEIPTGTKFWDWEIPKEWNLKSAQIINESNEVILDAKTCNLHVVSYSESIDKKLNLDELQERLHSIPELPDAIPYRTSYYEKNWGFCVTEDFRKTLKDSTYKVKIDSEFFNGSMTIGEIYLKGETESEILFSTYICHPMMANNELSGPAMAIALASYISSLDRYYSYRILFYPETLGSLYFLSQNLTHLKKHLIAGYVLTCVGDENNWNFMPSRTGIAISDKIALRILKKLNHNYNHNSFKSRGSDERQYCSPNIDLPVSSVMRSMYAQYPEYHTSKDDLNFISKKGLSESLLLYKDIINEFEKNRIPKVTTFGEPMLSKRNLRNNVGGGLLSENETLVSNILAFSDGSNDLQELSLYLEVPLAEIINTVKLLIKFGLVKYL